ncbi:MAG: phosphatidylserine decarboxylase family protein [Gemmatimonadales bacterium]
MRIAREGLPFIAVALVLLALFALWHWVAALLWLPIALWTVAFFRDPPRDRVRGDDLILAPADGLVVSVVPMDEASFLGGPSTRVSIFMNVFNVHVNRYPATGTVALREYQPGAFLNAMVEKASTDNEQASIGLETARGRILIRQIAGLVARRIVTDHQVGREVGQGDRLGLIRFGSRVDVFLPPNTQVAVRDGERTRAGETVVARWK